MLERDREAYPGGVMCGYILWISEQWRLWRTEKGYGPNPILSEIDHAEFDRWLNTRATFREAA